MKKINIKGKEYIPVNERLIHFSNQPQFKGWSIVESVVSIDDKEGIFKVTIVDDNGAEKASAHSQEYRDSSYINKTSFVENGFTSALGRALGYLGIGIDTSIASAEEVANAVKNQSKQTKPQAKPKLTNVQLEKTLNGTPHQAKKVFEKFEVSAQQREKIVQKFSA